MNGGTCLVGATAFALTLGVTADALAYSTEVGDEVEYEYCGVRSYIDAFTDEVDSHTMTCWSDGSIPLYIACHVVDGYWLAMLVPPEGVGIDKGEVRFRWDDMAPTTEEWNIGDGTYVYTDAPESIAQLLDNLSTSSRFLFQVGIYVNEILIGQADHAAPDEFRRRCGIE